MSIFGERIGRGPDTAEDYAKKEYVDAQVALHVLKAGDTMTGDLIMARGQVCGLPMNMNKRLDGDEALSQYQVVEIVTEALRHFRANRKPLVTIYAEEYGSLKNGEYEWCFGNGVSGGSSKRGYPMAVSGRLKYMSLAITTTSSGPGRNSHQRSSEPFVRCNQAPGPILQFYRVSTSSRAGQRRHDYFQDGFDQHRDHIRRSCRYPRARH